MGKYMLDTRDLYKRQQELQEEIDNLIEKRNDAEEAKNEANSAWVVEFPKEDEGDAIGALDAATEAFEEANQALADWCGENQEELDELNNLENEVGREWMHGETLIPEEDFVEYVQDLAEDIGAVSQDNYSWIVIDWEATADNVRQDYSEAVYQGTTYLFRMS